MRCGDVLSFCSFYSKIRYVKMGGYGCGMKALIVVDGFVSLMVDLWAARFPAKLRSWICLGGFWNSVGGVGAPAGDGTGMWTWGC